MAEYHRVAHPDDVKPGEAKAVEIGDVSVAIYNVDGNYFATNNVCSHDEAYLAEGWLDDDIVTCPAHGAEFSVRTGEALTLPASKPVATYPVKVEGDGIYVEL